MANKEVRLTLPPHIYARVWQEGKDNGNSMAATIRHALSEYYRRRAADIGLALEPLNDDTHVPALAGPA